MTIEHATIDTGMGVVHVAACHGTVVAACFADHWEVAAARILDRFPDERLTEVDDPGGAVTAIRAYLDGDLTAIDALDVDPGGTDFQERVWAALRTIPAGETRSYGELAEMVGTPGGMRAVGSANGANPIWLVVPCHRVVRSDGSLGGYAGGLDRKAWLLEHEGARERSLLS